MCHVTLVLYIKQTSPCCIMCHCHMSSTVICLQNVHFVGLQCAWSFGMKTYLRYFDLIFKLRRIFFSYSMALIQSMSPTSLLVIYLDNQEGQ